MRNVWVDISCNSLRFLEFYRPYRDKITLSFQILFESPPIINLPSDGTAPETMTAPCKRHAVCPVTPAACLAQARAAVVVMRCVLLGCYPAFGGKSSPMFRDNLSIPSSGVKKYKTQRRPYLHCGGSLKSVAVMFTPSTGSTLPGA
jgi:hypothetical protein